MKFGSGFLHDKDPKAWDDIEDPVVLCERNLCGHPLAGLLWGRKIEEVLFEKVIEKKVPTLECLYVHMTLGLFLSVSVGDVKMVGKKQHMDSICKTRQKETNFEDPTPLTDEVHLGCMQRDAKVVPRAVQSKTELPKSALRDATNYQRKMYLLFSKWQRHAQTIIKHLWKTMKQPESSLRHVLTWFKNACT